MPGLDWLTARPVAHRGLHDAANGVIENTPSAVRAAVAANYGIEIDLQVSADGEAMVHHDDALGWLTEGNGALAAMNAADIKAVAFKNTKDRIMTLGELCDLVAGQVTLLLELKSHFGRDHRLVARTVEVLTAYSGPVAVMSFDPYQVAAVRELAPGLPRGIVAEYRYDDDGWEQLTLGQRRILRWMLHIRHTSPHFIAYAIRDLPACLPLAGHWLFGLPLLTWTVRSEQDRKRAAIWASQMIFEGFRP